MLPRTRQTLAVASVIVALAAVAGIAAIQGWLPASLSGDTPVSMASPGLRIAGTAPAESLSPGESVVEAEARAPEPASAPPAPEQKAAPERKAAPKTRATCANCGVVAATSFDPREPRGAWEVRVKFDDGTRAALRFPTDPGFRVGERVLFANGRLRRA